MKCLICQVEMLPPTENAPRLFVQGRYFGACAGHFPSKRRFPNEWQQKLAEFKRLAEAEAGKRPASAGQIAMMQAVLERQGESVQPESQGVEVEDK